MTAPQVKRVASVSLGSSTRDKTVTATFFNQPVEIRRIGTDGDQARFQRTLAALDGTVDAIGFGGMDRYLWSEGKRYEFRAARALLAPATKTPVLDGSGLKNTLEREAVLWLQREGIVDFARSKTLMVAGVDRFGMSEALAAGGGEIVFGDLMFSLGLPLAIRGRRAHRAWARLLLPLIVQMPLSVLYPMGEKQDEITPRWESFYRDADIIAGDFLYIRRYLPAAESGALSGKIILTNTTTEADEEELRRRGVRLLITTTPRFDGRSFGTNVMEAVLVALNNGETLTEPEYLATLQKLHWTPNVRTLQPAIGAGWIAPVGELVK
ncbi:MAG: quinate 5-dehydrogenase [Cytophagales bacterium]|nr:quinate 5-dehydrogenase [Armatimonadota bacterium]